MQDLFRKMGLSEGEIKVYEALLKVGESASGQLAAQSKVSKSKVYDILEKLIHKGFASYVVKSGTKCFLANDPQMIIRYLDRKEEEIHSLRIEAEKILPEILAKKIVEEKHRKAEMYDGFDGLKKAKDEATKTLKRGETLFVLGQPLHGEKLQKWLSDFYMELAKKGIKVKILYTEIGKKESKEKPNLIESRYMPEASPLWVDICPDSVLIAVTPENPITFFLKDKHLAENFKAHFNFLWECAT